MPFGAAASGLAWHKIGDLLCQLGRKLLGIPLFRYVDDYFAVDRQRLSMHTPRVLTVSFPLMHRPETVKHALETFMRLIRAILGQDAVADRKVEHGNDLVILGIKARNIVFTCFMYHSTSHRALFFC